MSSTMERLMQNILYPCYVVKSSWSIDILPYSFIFIYRISNNTNQTSFFVLTDQKMYSTRGSLQQIYGDYLFGDGDVNENGKSEY